MDIGLESLWSSTPLRLGYSSLVIINAEMTVCSFSNHTLTESKLNPTFIYVEFKGAIRAQQDFQNELSFELTIA